MQDNQKIIFSNLINGVPVPQVAQAFHTTENEVMRVFSFVLRKIKNYIFLRQLPMIVASDIESARRYQITCLQVLPKLNLSKEPEYRDIQVEVVGPDNMMTVARNLNT